jgi:EmrB/QacA subfamily drug resistance transporter
VLTATVLASSVVFLEATVINVALPGIQQALGASVATMQWIASVYTLALAALTLVGGALGRLGRRRLLAVGLGLFTLASLAAGLAPNSVALIVARAVQGLGAALVAPNSLAHLSASFRRAERGRALGIWSAASALTGGAAPLLGGWLVDAVSWRTVFLFCVPLTLAALAVVVTRVPESRAPRGGAALDTLGAVLAALAFAAITAGLIGAAGRSDAVQVWAWLLSGLALLAAFIWWESHTDAPMMPPALFRSRAFSAANLLTLLLYFAVCGTFFLLPFTLVRAYGYSATLTGAVFLPFALIMGVLSGWAGGLIDRWGATRPLVLGPFVVAAGLALFGRPLEPLRRRWPPHCAPRSTTPSTPSLCSPRSSPWALPAARRSASTRERWPSRRAARARRSSASTSGSSCRWRRAPRGAKSACAPATHGSTCASASHAVTSAAATRRPTSTPRGTSAPAATRLSNHSPATKCGAGVTSMSVSYDHTVPTVDSDVREAARAGAPAPRRTPARRPDGVRRAAPLCRR